MSDTPINKEASSSGRFNQLSISDYPYEFARKWYDADNIHRSITRAEKYRSFGDLPAIPTDPYSVAFAEWLAEQYCLAMAKGAELCKREMQLRIDKIESEEHEGWCAHCACQSCVDSKEKTEGEWA